VLHRVPSHFNLILQQCSGKQHFYNTDHISDIPSAEQISNERDKGLIEQLLPLRVKGIEIYKLMERKQSNLVTN